MSKSYVYILSNVTNSVLYIGVTNNIQRRVYEHKNHLLKGFSDKYNTEKLVYVEEYPTIVEAIAREKQLKRWRRTKKDELIKSQNPEFIDLYDL